MRLIDADALKEKYGDYWDREIEHPKYQDTFGEIIDGMPTIEPKHGEWLFDKDGYFSCSVCGKKPHDQTTTTDYCPKCGAKNGG